MHKWGPARIISPCLSPHFKGTVARLCRLYRSVSTLRKMSPIVFSLSLVFVFCFVFFL